MSIIAFLVITSSAQAQLPPVAWQQRYGSAKEESFKALCGTADGGYIAAGVAYQSNADSSQNAWVVRVDAAGVLQWQQQYGGVRKDYATTVLQTSDGGYLVGGESLSTDLAGHHGQSDIWIAKLDATGAVQWERCYGGTQQERCGRILQLSDGSYVVAGSAKSTDGDLAGQPSTTGTWPGRAWLFKLDAAGNMTWSKTYGGSLAEGANDIRALPDGGLIVAGISTSTDGDVSFNHGFFDCWIFRTDAAGSIIWEQSLGGSADDIACGIIATQDGGFVVTAYTASQDGDVTGHHGGAWDRWVAKLGAGGNLLWQKALGGSGTDIGETLVQLPGGEILVGGASSSADGDVSNPLGSDDVWLTALDNASGNLLWDKSFGGSSGDAFMSPAYGVDLVTTPNGGLAFASCTGSPEIAPDRQSTDGYIVKFVAPDCDTFIARHDTALCALQPFALVLQPAAGAGSFAWNTGATTPVIQVADTGTYWRTATSGCHVWRDTFTVRHRITTNARQHDTLICIGATVWLAGEAGFDSYAWSTGDTAAQIQAGTAGTFIRMAQEECRLETDTFLVRHIPALAALTLGPDAEWCTDALPQVGTAIAGVSYQWSTGDTSCCIRPQATGNYVLTITNSCEEKQDAVFITLADCERCLSIPTAFTPNGDGRNDDFGATATCDIRDFRLRIYDRWGRMVYATDRAAERWNGLFLGQPAPLGTYFYSIRYRAADERVVDGKGEVTLIR